MSIRAIGVPDLPVPKSSFVGRALECEEICALIRRDDISLVTLTGPAGVGKTRLALAVAQHIRASTELDPCFVSLEAINDPELVIPAIAQSLGLVALGGRVPAAGLQDFLRERNTMLVLDNFEHVMDAASNISELLAACSRLTIVVTSRESLRIAGEQEFSVRPLSGSEGKKPAESDAVTLFVQRAQAVKPDFHPDTAELTTIATICARLDGLPLAIELAAARIKMLTTESLLGRLVDRFALLSRDTRGVPARLRTMRDAIGWSYDLLSDDERAWFRGLAVFPAGCTIEQADFISNWVTHHSGQTRQDSPLSAIDAISSLLDKSLMVRIDDRADGRTRFGMLQTIRAFGLDQLEAHDEEAATLDGLVGWFLELSDRAIAETYGANQRFWTSLLEAERDNLNAALEWSITQGDARSAARLLRIGTRFWQLRGYFAEGVAWSRRALVFDRDGVDVESRVTLNLSSAWIHFFCGYVDEAFRYGNRTLELAKTTGDPYLIAITSTMLGSFQSEIGAYQEAVELQLNAISLFRECNNQTWLNLAVNALGNSYYLTGEITAASALFEGALASFQSDGNSYGEGYAYTNLAKVARVRGDYPRALDYFRKALIRRWDHMDRLGTCGSLQGIVSVLALTGQCEEAARAIGATEALRESIGAAKPGHRTRYDESVLAVRSQLGDAAFARYLQLGRDTPLAMVVESLTGTPGPAMSNQSSPLSPREIEVLRLVRDGLSNRQIGERLFVSERTAQTHVQHILDKLDVPTRAAAASTAIERGLI